MTKLALAAIVAALACTGNFMLGSTAAYARDGYYCCYRPWVRDPGYRRYKFYRSPPRGFRSPCTYGDCACIRGYAVRTGAQGWWDRYQACTGG